MDDRLQPWHEIADEGLPSDIDKEYLITDGEDIFVGFWREDAKQWDNYNMGWVTKYYHDGEPVYPNITHWVELPSLPALKERKDKENEENN